MPSCNLRLIFKWTIAFAIISVGTLTITMHKFNRIVNKYVTRQTSLLLTHSANRTQPLIEKIANRVNILGYLELQKGYQLLVDGDEVRLSMNFQSIFGETLTDKIQRDKARQTRIVPLITTQYLENLSATLTETSGDRVPPMLHYILPYVDTELSFHHMVCMLSGFWILKPKYLILWHELNETHTGIYWDYFLRNISSRAQDVIIMYAPPPTQVYNLTLDNREHKSDIARMEILYKFGGIYMDLDVVAVKSFLSFYKYPFTIGRETWDGLCNGIMLAEKGSEFLHIWHTFYRHYNTDWSTMSVLFPHALYTYFRTLLSTGNFTLDEHLIHVEEESLDRPNWMTEEVVWIYDRKRVWDWKKKNYAVHLWFRKTARHLNFSSVMREDSMYGDLLRYILHGVR